MHILHVDTLEGRDAELASLQRQISQLAALVEESVKKKEPGSVVADAAGRGGWVAAPESQEPTLPLGGGRGFLQQQARDSGRGPRQLLKGGWAIRSGANPARPAGVGPGIGPDCGEARGLNPPAKEVLAELEKVYDPESRGSKQTLMRKMFDFAFPTHSNSNPIEHLYSLELLYARLREKGLNAEQPFVLAHFVGSLPPEYQQAKFLLETATALDRAEIVRIVSTVHASLPEGATALDRAEIVRIVSTVHASLPEGRKASKGQRRAEHALLASDGGGGGGAPGRGNSDRRKGGGGGGGGGNQKGTGGGAKPGGGSGGGDDDAGSMRGRCFRCCKKGHQVADCTENKPVQCETCKDYRHDKSKCPTEEAVLLVEVPAGGASADATALDVAEEALVDAPSTPVDINDFHCAHGHSHEVLLRTTAKQQGTTLVGELRECLGCSTAKGLSKPIPDKTSTRAEEEEEFATEEDEIGEGASSQGGGRVEGEFVDGGPGRARASPHLPRRPARPMWAAARTTAAAAVAAAAAAAAATAAAAVAVAAAATAGVSAAAAMTAAATAVVAATGDLPRPRGPKARRLARFDKPAELTSRRTRQNPRRNLKYESPSSPTSAEALLASVASLPVSSTEKFTRWMLSAVLHVTEGLEARAVREVLLERGEEAHAARQEAEDFLLGAVDLMGGEWPVMEAIGSMMWVTTFSRSDVLFAVRAVARHAHAPAKRHWDAIQKILGYLKGTRDLGITYQRGSGLGLAVYVEASYANTEDKRSVSGLETAVGGTVVSHGSKTQSIVPLSSTEAEYIAAGECVKEAFIQVLEDNQGAIALVQNPLSSGRPKHIDVRFHFIRGLFRSGDIPVKFVPTTEQHADLLTKALSRASLQFHRRKLMNLPE
ncbi:unnamed protein product [Ectocarpus sp. CCAP 1310/34]|nr:unnamed protein product [Ectocarpus sp. CCAP 1310/34]